MIMRKKYHKCRLFVGTFVVPFYFYETKSLHIWYFIRLYISSFPQLVLTNCFSVSAFKLKKFDKFKKNLNLKCYKKI